jgi:hypothetical protein
MAASSNVEEVVAFVAPCVAATGAVGGVMGAAAEARVRTIAPEARYVFFSRRANCSSIASISVLFEAHGDKAFE